jgi:acetoin utilization protein AcuB
MILAADVMHARLRTVRPSDTIWTALDIMQNNEIRHVLVTDADGTQLFGVLSNRDYRRVLDRTDSTGTIRGIREIRVEEIMTAKERLITGHPDTPILNIAQLMVLKGVGCVPILDGQHRPIGILTQKDVMQELTRVRLPKPDVP